MSAFLLLFHKMYILNGIKLVYFLASLYQLTFKETTKAVTTWSGLPIGMLILLTPLVLQNVSAVNIVYMIVVGVRLRLLIAQYA